MYLLAEDKTIADFLQDKHGYVSIITELYLIRYLDITEKELQQIKIFLEDCTSIEINDEIKTIYSRLRKLYRLKSGDAVAAATAIYLDLSFISADKEFSKVNELTFALYNK